MSSIKPISESALSAFESPSFSQSPPSSPVFFSLKISVAQLIFRQLFAFGKLRKSLERFKRLSPLIWVLCWGERGGGRSSAPESALNPFQPPPGSGPTAHHPGAPPTPRPPLRVVLPLDPAPQRDRRRCPPVRCLRDGSHAFYLFPLLLCDLGFRLARFTNPENFIPQASRSDFRAGSTLG